MVRAQLGYSKDYNLCKRQILPTGKTKIVYSAPAEASSEEMGEAVEAAATKYGKCNPGIDHPRAQLLRWLA